MFPEYWQKQTAGKPLYPDLLWSRPENRALAGKLLIIGGNAYGFAAPAEAYAEAARTGAGELRVLLPEAVKGTIGGVLEAADFVPATPSGSFSQKALAECLAHATWADGVLLAGDLGRNSETAILLEKFTEKYQGQLIIAKDAADYFTAAPHSILGRPGTALIISFAQLQKLAQNAAFPRAFTFGMDMLRLVGTLHDFTAAYPVVVITKHLQNIFLAVNGEVSSTKLTEDKEIWRVSVAARASVWWLQNPRKPFEALTTAIYESNETKKLPG